MQLVTVPPPLAPLATGHPLSLPELKRLRGTTARIEPIAKGGRTAGWDSALPGRNPDLGRHIERPDERQAPPPSLMQLYITELLAEQLQARVPQASVPAQQDLPSDPLLGTADTARTTQDAYRTARAAIEAAVPARTLPAPQSAGLPSAEDTPAQD